jgi:hypothetical protein
MFGGFIWELVVSIRTLPDFHWKAKIFGIVVLVVVGLRVINIIIVILYIVFCLPLYCLPEQSPCYRWLNAGDEVDEKVVELLTENEQTF